MKVGTLDFAGEQLTITRDKYADGNLALEAVDAEGAPYARLSVNFPTELLRDAGVLDDPEAFYLKDWSENVGIAHALVTSGLVEPHPTIQPISSGFITARAYRLTGLVQHGSRCVICGRDTSFGSGLFVNRVLAWINVDGEDREGYMCPECQEAD